MITSNENTAWIVSVCTLFVMAIPQRKVWYDNFWKWYGINDESYQQESEAETECAGPASAEYIRKHPKGFGLMKLMKEIQVLETYLLPVMHLKDVLQDGDEKVINVRHMDDTSTSRKSTYNKIMNDDNVILGDIRRTPHMTESRAYLRAGPRKALYFDPQYVNAAIVTCGGLCPGLNNVIRHITLALWDLYGVRKIYGIRDGFSGFYNWKEESNATSRARMKPLVLTPDVVANIHHSGGTILGSNRGGFDVDKILGYVNEYNISHLYVIGGDGTHRAADKIAQEAISRHLRLSVAGVPKTIDNDVDLLDRSFGFNTSVEEAQRAIRSAKTEASCVPNGIGIVKLMGRSAGFISAHATLSSGDVNLCLVPEVPIVLTGQDGCLAHIEHVLERQGHAVIVVAEGAGEELLGECTEVDAGGNKKLPPIGEFLKRKVTDHFNGMGKTVTVKYIDPSYMIRSVAANAADSLYCMMLGQNAVHGAMAGYTAFTVGLSANRTVFLPISAVTMNSPRCMDPFGRTWERVLCLTRQPNNAKSKKISGATNSD